MDYQNNYANPYNSYQQQAQTQPQSDGVFGWDDEIKEESSFILLPEGDYVFTIKKFEKGRYDGGDKIPACPKAIVTFTVYTNDGQCIDLQENFLLHKKMEWKLSEFFASIGMKKKDEPVRMLWTPELIGKQGICKVVVHNYKKDGENRQTNRIDKLYPSYNQPALAPPSQQAPPQQYQQPQTQYTPSQQTQPWQQGWK